MRDNLAGTETGAPRGDRTPSVSANGRGRVLYVVARRHGGGTPRLFRVGLRSGEKALPVFFSGWSAHNFVFSNGLEREWRVGERSPDELAELLAAPLARVDWVLLDPPALLENGEASAALTHRGNFLEYLRAYRASPRRDYPYPGLEVLDGRPKSGAWAPEPPGDDDALGDLRGRRRGREGGGRGRGKTRGGEGDAKTRKLMLLAAMLATLLALASPTSTSSVEGEASNGADTTDV